MNEDFKVRKGSLFMIEQTNPTLLKMKNTSFDSFDNSVIEEEDESELAELPELTKDNVEKYIQRSITPPPMYATAVTGNEDEQKPKGPAAKLWDIFRITSPDKEELSESWCLEVTKRVCKVIVYWLLLFFILGSTVIHKITLMISVAQSRTERWITCDVEQYGNEVEQSGNTTNSTVVNNGTYLTDCKVEEGVNRSTIVTDRVLCGEVSVRWIWGLAVTMCFPYLLTFMQCLFKVLFKKTLWPSVGTFFAVLVVETCHSVGLFIFVFLILPFLDIIQGLLIMHGVALIPSLLQLLLRPRANVEKYRPLHIFSDSVAILVQLSALFFVPTLETIVVSSIRL
ncbi:uncharacterized protein LOC106176542 [Lingula anatina]|uniref:Uncharacterized protein LOC106176542 n=1 Tax=Lingula anatina TaxID=7574 RepID=A0A1S3JWI9_LINAN|nr:uncharacterized protein LOC106176542 [Lingula anatina]|eukprot:XP_013414431.1 uncharacterized protein LOC106176542 [Lingula anatina]